MGEIIKLTAGHCICDQEDMSHRGDGAVLVCGRPQRADEVETRRCDAVSLSDHYVLNTVDLPY